MRIYFKVLLSIFTLMSLFTSVKAGGGKGDETAGFRDVEFTHLVRCFKENENLEVGDKKFVFIKEDDIQESVIPMRTLLKRSDIYKIPSDANFFMYCLDNDQRAKFITLNDKDEFVSTFRKIVSIGFTSNDNPHWQHNFSQGPFGDPIDRYWYQEPTTHSVEPLRTINFLLQEVDLED